MFFTPENREDINKYYRNSFLKFKETGDTLYYITNVDANMVSGQVENGRDFKLYLAKEEPYEVDYVLPHKSFFQYGDNAVMLQRIPAKQYHRGLTPDNTMVSFRGVGGAVSNLPIDFIILGAFVKKQKFFSLGEAMKKDLTSCVLSPRMMYVKQTKNIYIDFTPVATVEVKTKKITMLAPIFEEEIRDFLKATQEEALFTIGEAK